MAQTKYLDMAGLQALLNKLFAREFRGMGLSTNDFSDALKQKLESLTSPEDLTALTAKVAQLEALVAKDSDGVINKFNEIVAFLAGIGDDKTLDGLMADIAAKVAEAKKAGDDAASALDAFKGTVYTKAQADGAFVAKAAGKGLSTNDYTTAEKNAVATIGDKVDKVAGKQLSTNDYTDSEKALVATISDKVAKEDGKGLSSNDYTTAEKNAVATIANKVDKVTGKGLSTNDYTSTEKALVATIGDKLNAADVASISSEEIASMLASAGV